MRIFTKTIKIPFAHLRKKDHVSIVYVDDSYLQGKTYKQCLKNITDSINILQELVFTIHPIKSCFTPKQKITFLGFEFDSCSKTITLTKNKKEKIKRLCKKLLTPHKICQRELASVIDNTVASSTAVPYDPFYYGSLAKDTFDTFR